MITANDYFNFWSHIYINRKHWEECDVILTCPLVHAGACKVFGEEKLFLLNSFSDLLAFCNQYKTQKAKSIGVISFQVVNELIKQSEWLTRLMQLCSMNVVLASHYDSLVDLTKSLDLLHAIGFYHVLTLLNQDNISYLSQEIFSDATKSSCFYYSRSPGISAVDNAYITHVACRTSYMDLYRYPWLSALGRIEYLKNGYLCGLPEQLSISTKQMNRNKDTSCTIDVSIINATFYWHHDFIQGDVSLVSSYHGPTDANMYALMLRGDNWPYFAIWKSDANCQWSILGAENIDLTAFAANHNGGQKVSLWLKTTSEYLMAGIGQKMILKIKDNSIARNHIMGLRFYTDKVLVSEVKTQYLKENDEKV
jgi:hypothetical protein